MKTILMAFFTTLALPLSGSSARADGFGYQALEKTGNLAVVVDPYYEQNGIQYPIADLPSGTNFCAAFGLNRDANQDPRTNNYFESFSSPSPALVDWKKKQTGLSTDYVKAIFCGLAENSTPSTSYQSRIVEADGSITFIDPTFLYLGKQIPFIHSSSVKGICMLLGQGKALGYSEKNTALAGPRLYFFTTGYDAYGNKGLYHQTSIWNYSDAIGAVTCAAK